MEEQHHNEDIEQEEEFLEAEMTTGWEQQLVQEPTARSAGSLEFRLFSFNSIISSLDPVPWQPSREARYYWNTTCQVTQISQITTH